jgi:hypothetical protein
MSACRVRVLFALVVLTAACDRAPPPWHRAAWRGVVTLRGPDLDVRGRVTFVRPATADIGTLQFDVERDGHLDNATLLASGKTTAFRDGVPRPIAAREERALQVLAAWLRWPGATAETRARNDGAALRLPDATEYAVTVVEEASADPHHGRR